MNQPNDLRNMLRAAAGALPVVSRTDQLPSRTVTVEELPIDQTNVAEYAAITGLRYGNTVPLTYPFALTFPALMSLVTGFDFPFAAMGSVHTENHITQYRPIAVTDTVGVRVHAENLREHRKGLLVDLVTEVSVGNDVAWHQVTTFLHQQRTSLSDEPKPPPQKQPKLPPPPAVLRITPGQIHRYAVIGGDHNPIHTNPITAKLFGFPTVIAHGMFTAAAVLANIEARIPGAARYSVRFGKPVLLPATAGLYIDEDDQGGWELTLRNIAKGYPHLTGSVRPLQQAQPARSACFCAPTLSSLFSPCAAVEVSRKTPNSHSGGRASSQTKIAAQIGEPWVTASTPAAPVSATAGTCRCIPAIQLIVSTSTAPAAAPVVSAGVSMPPARRNRAVSSGFNSRIAVAAVSVSPLARLTVRILRPLPGNSGNQCEQMPIASPVAASAGISTQLRIWRAGRAAAISRLNASPTASAIGAMTRPCAVSRYLDSPIGQCRLG